MKMKNKITHILRPGQRKFLEYLLKHKEFQLGVVHYQKVETTLSDNDYIDSDTFNILRLRYMSDYKNHLHIQNLVDMGNPFSLI